MCWYLLLTVTFRNHVVDKLIMRSDEDGPNEEKLKGVQCKLYFRMPLAVLYLEFDLSTSIVSEHMNFLS